MSVGLIGKKCGMTRVFTPEGVSHPVTVIALSTLRVTQLKTQDSDGYSAIQVAAGEVKASKVSKPMAGHYAKANVLPGEMLVEFPLSEKQGADYQLGQELPLDLFVAGQLVDVTSVSKGKGFAGVLKRHNFSSQDATHGNSVSHRAPGSIGQRQTPGRVFKGKRMAGHMGNRRCTVQNQSVIRFDADRKLLLVEGSVPGAPGTTVFIKAAVKKAGKGGEE